MGQPKSQPATVVFDSGSNWLTVMASGAERAYIPNTSKASRFVGGLDEPQNYGSATIEGVVYQDTVCLSMLDEPKNKPVDP